MRPWLALGTFILAAPYLCPAAASASEPALKEAAAPSFQDREGLFFTLSPRLVVIGAGVFVSGVGGSLPGDPPAAESSFSRAWFGGGLNLDLAIGHDITPGLALAFEGSVGMAFGAVTTRIPHDKPLYLFPLSVGVGLHHFPPEASGFHYHLGLGLQSLVVTGGSNDIIIVGGPPRFSFDPMFGPRLALGAGWVIAGALDVGVGLEAAYVFGPSTTSMLPVTLSARASLLLF
jgi:hypothetical protein